MLSKQIFPFYKWKYMAGARAGAGEKIMKKIVAGAGAEISALQHFSRIYLSFCLVIPLKQVKCYPLHI